MANHVRRQLREAVATAVTGLATTGTRVFQSRAYNVAEADLPCLLVYTTDEPVQIAELGIPAVYQRDITVEVVGLAMASNDVDDVLDQIGKEVETALAGALTVGGGSVSLDLTNITSALDVSDQLAGSITHTYTATVFTTADAPDVALNR